MANDTQPDNVVRVLVHIKTDKIGSDCADEIKFDRDVWESMTEEQRDSECMETAFNHIDWHWEEL